MCWDWKLSCYQIWVRIFLVLASHHAVLQPSGIQGGQSCECFGCSDVQSRYAQVTPHSSTLYLLRPLPALITLWSWDPTFPRCRAVPAALGNPFLHPTAASTVGQCWYWQWCCSPARACEQRVRSKADAISFTDRHIIQMRHKLIIFFSHSLPYMF